MPEDTETEELPPYYDCTKGLEEQHKRARATPDAVERCRKRHEMEHAKLVAKHRASMMFALAFAIMALMG